MTVQGSKHIQRGPLKLNFAARGFLGWRLTSWSVRIGPWSWNSRTERQRIDLPGPWSWTSRKHPRRDS